MPLHLYNTLTKCEEEFTPRTPGRATMYTCGPTVYSRPHIGNYAAFLMADLLRRWLEAGHGLEVTHVKNITDVGHLLHDADSGDDKIQAQAEKEKVHPLDIAHRYIEEYLEDEKALNFIEPEHRPRATAFVEEMKAMTEALLASGHAYVTDDGIYFDVTAKTPTPYGTLSGNTLEALKAGARVEVKEGKRNAADFALWKFCVGANAQHVLRWPSPKSTAGGEFPEGFPGWHIECSAMARALLGDQIDIHTGGEDNIFPHHECEIAQSESVTGKAPFVGIWLHRRRINLDGEKMSKSLGNVLTIPQLIADGFDPMDIRYSLLSVHYRTNLAFSRKGLEDAKKARRKITEWMEEMERATAETATVESAVHALLQRSIEAFQQAMDQDLNTSAALAVVFETMSMMRAAAEQGQLDNDALHRLGYFVAMVRHTFGCFDKTDEVIPSDVQALLDERAQARTAKNFAESDRLRDAIAALGYAVRDADGGQTVHRL